MHCSHRSYFDLLALGLGWGEFLVICLFPPASAPSLYASSYRLAWNTAQAARVLGRSMDSDEELALRGEVDEVDKATVGAKSRAIYNNAIFRMIVWLQEKMPRILTQDFVDGDCEEGGKLVRARVLEWLARAPEDSPIKWELFSPAVFKMYLASLVKSDGMKPGRSTYGTTRSSISHLFRIYEQRECVFSILVFFQFTLTIHSEQTIEWKAVLEKHFKGKVAFLMACACCSHCC